MSSRVFKNYQVNVGIPFQINSPVNFHTIKTVSPEENCDSLGQGDIALSDDFDSDEIIQKAREEAEMIIKEAQYEAIRIMENAEAESCQKRAEIEEEAHQKGYSDGYSEAKTEYEGLIKEAQQIREQARVEYSDVISGIESDVMSLVMDIARKVIGNEIATNRESILYIVRQALEKCTGKEGILLKVSPDDLDYISENKEMLANLTAGVEDIEIRKDSSLTAGACVLETDFGSVDAGIDTKLKNIAEAFSLAAGK